MILLTEKNIKDFDLDLFNPNFEESKLICDKWLSESVAKRYIYNLIYSDLIDHKIRYNILDIGGGVTSFTPKIIESNEYTLCDLLNHGGKDILSSYLSKGQSIIIEDDWMSLLPRLSGKKFVFDFIIASDIFPNVDQRIDYFLDKFLPYTKQIRMTVTFFYQQKFYKVKRTDAEEILFMKSWDIDDVKRFLLKYKNRIINFDEKILSSSNNSLFKNGRQVLFLSIRGDQ